jgi:hypothetical protein
MMVTIVGMAYLAPAILSGLIGGGGRPSIVQVDQVVQVAVGFAG